MKQTRSNRFARALPRSLEKPAASRWMAAAAVTLMLPAGLFADASGMATMQNGNFFSFDTGSTSSTGADITYAAGTLAGGITPVGKATAVALGTLSATDFNNLTAATLASKPFSAISLFNFTTPMGSSFAVHTNGGNYAKATVTAISSTSITFTYTTIGASATTGGTGGTSGGAVTPTITDVESNSSLIPAGFSNSGIAPSMLIVIHGTNLANTGTPVALQNTQAAGGLPTLLNGASVSVSAAGKTYQLPIYYTSSTQIDAVLLSTVPVGPAYSDSHLQQRPQRSGEHSGAGSRSGD